MDFLCLDFINSQWYLTHRIFEECFEREVWIDRFCSKWELSKQQFYSERDALKPLRACLYQAALGLCENGRIGQADLEAVNQHLLPNSFCQKIEREDNAYVVRMVPIASNAPVLAHKIILSFTELITEYQLDRIKLCSNPDCDWFFYDSSKNHTRKWCDNTCASLMKVRRFRAARKQSP